MSKRKKINKDKTVGYGFVGEWSDKQIGWGIPTSIHNYNRRRCPERLYFTPELDDDDRVYLCRISITRLRDKAGRYIVRRPQ